MMAREWQVLLLGGASGVGKSSLSYNLARHYNINLTEVDDIQVALTKLLTPEQQPLLHFWRTHWEEFNSWHDQQHLEFFTRLSRDVFQPPLEAIVANHLETNRPIILDGDFILPELATFKTFNDQANNNRVKAIFVYEESEAQIAANYLARDNEEQVFRAHLSWINNQWLKNECKHLGIPALSARPWETVLERAVKILG